MGMNELSQKLISCMEKEISLMDEFSAMEEGIRQYIRESDWEKLNTAMTEIEPVSIAIEKAEEERGGLFAELKEALGCSEDAGFYHVIVHLEAETREKLSALYRALKLSVITVQGITWSIDAHVRAVGNTIGQVLDELFPHRKGKIYSSEGMSRSPDSGPILVNHSL